MEKKSFLRWFKNQKLGKKILYAFILSSLIPLIVVQGIMLYVNSNNMVRKMDEIMGNQLIQMAERVQLTLNVYTNLVYQAYIDNQIIESINQLSDHSYKEKEVAVREILDQIQQYGTAAEGIVCISVIATDGQQVSYDFREASAVRNLWENYSDYREIEPYKKAQEVNGIVITPTERFNRKSEERIFHISKAVYDYKNLDKGSIAVIVMSVDESVLNAICTADNQKDSKKKYSINFITDHDDNILSYPNSFYTGIRKSQSLSAKEFVKATGMLEESNTEVNRYEDKNLGWVFYNVYDRDYMLKEVYDTQQIVVMLGLLITMLSIIMILYTIHLIGQSTRNIIGGIRKVQEGNLDVKVKVEAKDEFGQIAENFNTMTDKVQNLISEVTSATEKQKEAEIRALEAQINPHFLYNTLDSINWMAIDKGEYEISRMLRDLGVILRYSINKSNQKVDIIEEVDWLKKYIGLQQVRFNHKFTFELHVDRQVERIQVYKLLIQPFVENSLIHGFRELSGGGILRVDIFLSEDEEMLHIIIEDNGIGMPAEQTHKFNAQNLKVENDGGSLGMANAFARMKMYYGEQASWNVSSISGVGTIITLRIPVEERKRGYEDYNR